MTEPTMTYPQAKARLQEIVAELQGGGVDLDRALQLHSEAEAAQKICTTFIDQASAKLAEAGVAA